MSDLVASVQSLLQNYVESKRETHVDIDVIRVLRDQSALLYERQLCIDALRQDPMQQLLPDYESTLQRFSSLLQVVSCHRVVTHDGLSMVDAVIRFPPEICHTKMSLTKGGGVSQPKSQLQMSFSYKRQPQHQQPQQQRQEIYTSQHHEEEGTHVKYMIHIQKDFEQQHRLLDVECWAKGNAPSQEPAVPMDGWEDMESEMEEDTEPATRTITTTTATPMNTTPLGTWDKSTAINNNQSSTNEMDATREEMDDADRFAAFLDPDVVEMLREWAGLEEMEDGPLIFFIMTFPFWEQEWDLVTFVLDSVFGEDDDDDDDVIEFDEEGDELL